MRQITVAAATTLFAGPVLAAELAPADAFASAVAEMLQVLGPQEQDQLPPPAADPDTRRRLATIDSAIAVFGTSAFPLRDYATFEAVCAPLNQLSVRYQLAGIKALAPLKDKPPEVYIPQLQALMTANTVKYQDVVLPLLSANVKCMALHMPVFERFWDSLPPEERTPVRADGLARIRNGTGNMLVGLAIMGVDRGMTQANRNLAIKTAAAYASAFARAMPVAQRKMLQQQISQSAPGLAQQYPDEFASIALALAQSDCAALCLVP